MDKLSKLMCLKNESYLEFLKSLQSNYNDIYYLGTKAFIELSESAEKISFLFPTYGRVDDKLNDLRNEKNEIGVRYRFLRNKILYTEKLSSTDTREYDACVEGLNRINGDIELLEMYQKALHNEQVIIITNSESAKEKILASAKKELEERSQGFSRYILLVNEIQSLNRLIGDAREECFNYYIEVLPTQRKDIQIEKSVKKKTEKQKKQKGGKPEFNQKKLKLLIKSKLSKAKGKCTLLSGSAPNLTSI
jgi:hypothetical protein